jgi:hypothetical protein
VSVRPEHAVSASDIIERTTLIDSRSMAAFFRATVQHLISNRVLPQTREYLPLVRFRLRWKK